MAEIQLMFLLWLRSEERQGPIYVNHNEYFLQPEEELGELRHSENKFRMTY